MVKKETVSQPSTIGPVKGKRILPWHLILVVVLVSLGVYGTALFNDFVYDDILQIVNNNWIKDIRYAPEIFTANTWGFSHGGSNYYRPLLLTGYMLEYYIFGLNPWGFHLVNILLHTAVSVLVFLIVFSLPRERVGVPGNHWFPFIAALLFAAHPIHTEAVAWVAGFPDLSFSFFYLLSFYLYTRSTNNPHLLSKYYLLSLASFSLSLLSKEPAVTLPVMLLAYDAATGTKSTSWRSFLRRYFPYLVLSALYLILRSYFLGGFAPYKRHGGMTIYGYVINVFPLLEQYLQKLALPANLNAFYIFQPIQSILQPTGLIALLIVSAYVFAGYLSFKHNRILFLALAFIIVPLLPALYIPGLGENTFAERYLYLPSVGYVMIVSLCISAAIRKKPEMKNFLAVVVAALLIIYSMAVVKRNAVWKDNYSLWADTITKSPNDAIVEANFGDALLNDKGRVDEAIEHLQSSLRLHPIPHVYNNLGLALSKKGRTDEAVEQFQAALRLKHDYVSAYVNMGIAYEEKGWHDRAIEQFSIAAELSPEDGDIHGLLGSAYAKKGLIENAIIEFQTALKFMPDAAELRFALGSTYDEKGLRDQAIEQYQTAIRLRPGYAEARNNLGIAYGMKGLVDEAIEQLQEAVRLDNSKAAYHYNLAKAYDLQGRHDKAEEQRRAARARER